MYGYVVDGNILLLPLHGAFTINDHQYPANWLELSSAADKIKRNIFPVIHGKKPLTRYGVITQQLPVWDETASVIRLEYSVSEPSLDKIKKDEIDKLNKVVDNLLSKTNKMVLNAHDYGTAIDEKWIEHRRQTRAEFRRLKDAITTANSVSSLVDILTKASFPK